MNPALDRVLFMDRLDGSGAEAATWAQDVASRGGIPVPIDVASYAGSGYPDYKPRTTYQALDVSIDNLLEHVVGPCSLTLVGASLGTVVGLNAAAAIRREPGVQLVKVILVVPATDPDATRYLALKQLEQQHSGRSRIPPVMHDLFDAGSPYLPNARRAIATLSGAGVDVHAVYSPNDTYCRFDGSATAQQLRPGQRRHFFPHPLSSLAPATCADEIAEHLWYRDCTETLQLVADILAGRPTTS